MMLRTITAYICCTSLVCVSPCFSSAPTAQPSAESFVVKKKKSVRAGSKSKENVCREFGQIAQTSARVVEKVAQVQSVGLDHTAQYLEGEDPFDGMTKAQMQELARRSQALEHEMSALCRHCDEYAQFQKALFTKKSAS